ncbi:RNA binding S1 domain protein [Desulfofundulus kuznetsovii DSM 6115]|uniref:RNA binding S1 domain protein n=1 Tax=Desulfofundulus kuznetsovii (strain DSM 6115 / VKM B-1805 / 17) TaxID=760568 RepID=A0AAU8PB42_DESK7|nr:RNA binding S1 domain protein [Desulfofundulus kuznetsovii DSM 6115]
METGMETRKEFFQDVWPDVFASRQKRKILRWPVVGVKDYTIRSGEEKKKVQCLVVGKEQVLGIIPFEESGIKPGESAAVNRARMMKYLGQEVAFIVIGLDTENDRFIASRKAALEVLSAQAWPNLKEGMVVTVTARKVYENAVVVEFDGIEAHLPVYEISHGWVDEIYEIIQPGDVFDVKIIELDSENKKVTVSLKALIPNPWPGAAKRYEKNGVYRGTVTGVTRYGVFVALEPGVNALCSHLKSNFRVDKGDVVAIAVRRVELKEDGGRVSGSLVRVLRKNRAAS